jgi:S-adenosyl-L-methionine hydrolase (adenosine-forming)
MSHIIPSPSQPVIALITDFGLHDGYIGIMKGVITTINSNIHIIDITHAIPPQNIASAAWTLSISYRYFPKHTVFVCIVDPGVGSSRQAIAIHAGDWFFIGPDNGLFSYILAEQPIHTAVALSNPLYHLAHISSTFHGRDIFAPTSAHLAQGTPISDLGTPIDPTTLQRINIAPPMRQQNHIQASIVHIDHFGNLITNIPLSLVPELFSHTPEELQIQITFPTLATVVKQRHRFFSQAPDDRQPFIYEDSSGHLGIAVRNGNAASTIGAELGTPITYISPQV